MKIIDIYNKVANGEEVPHFIIDEIEYYIGTDGFVKDAFGEEVEWTIDKQWLNEEVQILEEVEDKEYENIEKMDRVNGSDLVDLQSNSTLIDQNKAVTNLIMYLNMNVAKINALIKNQKYILEQLNK